MKAKGKVLFTGGSGFVGRNVVPSLRKDFDIVAPCRHELDLRDKASVAQYVFDNDIRYIVHAANPNPVKSSQFDDRANMFEDSLRVFMHVYCLREYVDRILYLGSGAEYDKSLEISRIKEDEVFRSMPADVYGCTKYIMNELVSGTSNMTNLRVFACYGPGDHESKFITHCIACVKQGTPITIRQDCVFDYMHVYDLGKVIAYFLENAPAHRDYNVASGEAHRLSEIARMVMTEMGVAGELAFLSEGLNREYTANIDRLVGETGLPGSFISLDEGVRIQIASEEV